MLYLFNFTERCVIYSLCCVLCTIVALFAGDTLGLNEQSLYLSTRYFLACLLGFLAAKCVYQMIRAGMIFWRLIPAVALAIGGPLALACVYDAIQAGHLITSATLAQIVCTLLKYLYLSLTVVCGLLPHLLSSGLNVVFVGLDMQADYASFFANLAGGALAATCGWLIGHLLSKRFRHRPMPTPGGFYGAMRY